MNQSKQNAIQYIFVDEAGDTSISTASNKEDFYVICAVYCSQQDYKDIEKAAQDIVACHAKNGELKSNKIGNKLERRKKILVDIAKHNFAFFCLAIKKELIRFDSGLRFKSSSYKYLHDMFYARLIKSLERIHIVVDDFGSSTYMNSFKKYISNSLGWFHDLEFESSKDIPLLQIADIVGGTVRRVLRKDDPQEILNIIGYPNFPIEEWPPLSTPISTAIFSDSSEYDQIVCTHCVRKARDFVEAVGMDADESKKVQAEAIRYLLQRLATGPNDYVFRNEVVRHIRESIGIEITENDVSVKICAKARDEGVILASTNDGIKIPFRAQDLKDWIESTRANIEPRLRRIQNARQDILIVSHNKYNIVEPDAFPTVAKYLDCLNDIDREQSDIGFDGFDS